MLTPDEKGFFSFCCPKKFADASLETCDKQAKEIIEFGRSWAEKPVSIFLTGGVGTGKTRFAFALIREQFRRCKIKLWPRYFTSPELDSRLLKASKSEEGDEYELHKYSTTDLLFIDDLGRETKSDRLRRQYFEILNSRYSNELPTVITSNLSLEGLGEILDPAIASRVQEWHVIEFTNNDLRKPI